MVALFAFTQPCNCCLRVWCVEVASRILGLSRYMLYICLDGFLTHFDFLCCILNSPYMVRQFFLSHISQICAFYITYGLFGLPVAVITRCKLLNMLLYAHTLPICNISHFKLPNQVYFSQLDSTSPNQATKQTTDCLGICSSHSPEQDSIEFVFCTTPDVPDQDAVSVDPALHIYSVS